AALRQGPDDVGVGDVVRGPAESIEGTRVALEAALTVFAPQQILPRPLQHLRIDVEDASHVAELQETVSRQRLVRRSRAAEPFVALPVVLTGIEPFERGQC